MPAKSSASVADSHMEKGQKDATILNTWHRQGGLFERSHGRPCGFTSSKPIQCPRFILQQHILKCPTRRLCLYFVYYEIIHVFECGVVHDDDVVLLSR